MNVPSCRQALLRAPLPAEVLPCPFADPVAVAGAPVAGLAPVVGAEAPVPADPLVPAVPPMLAAIAIAGKRTMARALNDIVFTDASYGRNPTRRAAVGSSENDAAGTVTRF